MDAKDLVSEITAFLDCNREEGLKIEESEDRAFGEIQRVDESEILID